MDRDYQLVTLSSGLRVVHRTAASPVGYCGFAIDCGTRDEAEGQEYGMAHFCEHILFKGTSHRDSWHINQRIESVGGELNAFTTKEDTTFYSVFLNRDFGRACELLCDLICHPTAPQHELEKEQEVVVDEIMSYLDTPSELVFDELENRLYQGSPLGHNILGSEETVRAFDHDRCCSFIGQHYRPERMVFFHVGSTPFERVIKALERWFDLPIGPEPGTGTWQRPTLAGCLTGPWGGRTDVIRQETHQSHVVMGFPAYRIGHPEQMTLSLLNNLMGGPYMNSRLNRVLREKYGLVYSVESSVTQYTDAGYMSVYFGCDHNDVGRCCHLVRHQLEQMCDHPLSDRQLMTAKKQLKGQLGITSSNLENRAISLAKNIMRRGCARSLEEIGEEIESITPSRLLSVAGEVFDPAHAVTVIIQ